MATDELSRLDDGRPAVGDRDTPPSPAGRPPVPDGHKWCGDCRAAKPYDDFAIARDRKDGRQSICRSCSAARTRERLPRIRNRVRERYATDEAFRDARKRFARESGRIRSARTAQLLSDLRAGGCVACGELDESCLDFHHLDPKTKTWNIAQDLKRHRSHRDEIVDEAKRLCVVLCANCHARVHAGQIQVGD